MTDNDNPWEPPRAGSETEHLVGALDRLRMTFRGLLLEVPREGGRGWSRGWSRTSLAPR